jgi:hypothetical protein
MERSIKTEFSKFDDKQGFQKLLTDLSKYDFTDECWHNEAMPHVCKMMPTEKYPDRALRVWMDFKSQKKSEIYCDAKKGETYYRFNVQLNGEYGDGDTTEFSKDFETMDEAIKFVEELIK